MTRLFRPALIALLLLAGGVGVYAQLRFGGGSGGGRRYRNSSDQVEPRPGETWPVAPGFEKDVFTFVRTMYSSDSGESRYWHTDAPDADWNLTYRLQQMTSLKVHPDLKFLRITDPEYTRYPFVYIVEPGHDLYFTDEEIPILRRYLLNGGFLMVDDFWGEAEWQNFADQIQRVFPDRKIVDLPRTHPIFHSVFDLPNDLNLQCPNIDVGTRSEFSGVTWERSDAKEAHFRGIYDDQGRLCVMICHNTDNGDGWEREGENHYYFKEFSEKKSYPLTINIIFYAMTH